jgi:hypothetical protein
MTKGQQAIRKLARAMVDRTGNLPSLPGIYPDYPAQPLTLRATTPEGIRAKAAAIIAMDEAATYCDGCDDSYVLCLSLLRDAAASAYQPLGEPPPNGYIRARRAIPVTVHQPIEEHGTRQFQGRLLGAMYARGVIHHYRVEGDDGHLYLTPPGWMAGEVNAPALMEAAS